MALDNEVRKDDLHVRKEYPRIWGERQGGIYKMLLKLRLKPSKNIFTDYV